MRSFSGSASMIGDNRGFTSKNSTIIHSKYRTTQGVILDSKTYRLDIERNLNKELQKPGPASYETLKRKIVTKNFGQTVFSKS